MNIASDFLPPLHALRNNVFRFDVYSRRTQIGRSLIALSQLLTLTLTNWSNLTTEVAGRTPTEYCHGPRAISVFCVGGPGVPVESGRWIGVAILALVIAGIFPPAVSALHAWVAISMQLSLSLPDGGEAVAAFATVLIIPIVLADRRICAWVPRPRPVPGHWSAISYAASLTLCIQLAGIYFESGLAKLAVTDWANGTALYYDLRDPSFGASGITGVILRAISNQAWGTAALTWGTIAIETAIAVAMVSASRYKQYALVAIIVLHVGILLAMGLWSFSLIMIGTATVAAYVFLPATGIRRSSPTETAASRQGSEDRQLVEAL